MQIVFLCSEYEGLLKTGGLADATRGLAQALRQQGHQLTIVLPRYGALYELPVQQQWQSVYVEMNGQQLGAAVRHLVQDDIQITLIEHHDFFNRPRPYDDGEHAYPDNALRFAFFCKAALAYLAQLPASESPAIIHGHDWQSALGSVYLKQLQQLGKLQSSRFVLSIHNAAYQQGLGWHDLPLLDLCRDDIPQQAPLSMLSIGVLNASQLNTVSEGYREELLSEPAANGLSQLYQTRQADFTGILNGCDYSRWDPATDHSLVANYSAADLSGKALCKAQLLRQVGLADSKMPLFVAVSRVTGQKGFSFLIPALAQWLVHSSSLVVMMGTGEQQFIQPLKALQQQFPSKFRFIEGFDDDFSHQLEAAGDFFLMPSLFEPCGLNQIYSLRYGTLPIVRATGGLKDTVVGLGKRGATGVSFEQPTAEDLMVALQQAESLFNDARKYKTIQQRAMNQYFGWDQAAVKYQRMYLRAFNS
ncbi:MAG: glycogen synthase [Gammaproteobacteria bacterium]|nr:glycogen synthase [Gammaproteobacteria bacterium]